MRNRLMATIAGAVLALSNFAATGCGTPEEQNPPGDTDAGTSTDTDAGTETDGGVTEDPDPVLTLTRLNANGSVDTAFGSNGTATVDLGKSETLWAADLDADGKVVLFGNKTEEGRTDGDRYVVRVGTDGKLDETFATKGVHTFNMSADGKDLSDQARAGFVQPDGKILAAGYVSAPTGVGTQAANKIVLLRLNSDGTPDDTFGTNGVAESNPFATTDGTTPWGMAEAYAAGLQSTGGYVTPGYGREQSSGKVDLVSFRFSATGTLDNTWNTTGKQILDIAGDDDRGRNLVVLPDDRVLMVGSGKPTATNLDGMAVMLTKDGELDASFGNNGRKLYEFGRPDEAFFAAAAGTDYAAAAGYRRGAAAGVEEDDDATLLILPLAGGTEFAREVPFSESENDRIWGLTFDANGKILATGFVANGEDNQTVVARFNTDGTRDTTFGTGGVVTLNLSTGGAMETGRAVVVQADGKILVAGLAEKK